LDKRFLGIVSCQVIVEAAHHHQNKGRLYSVRIDITLPGGELVVSHHPGKNPRKHDKVFAAMNNAFAAIDRQLERFKDLKHREIKQHEEHFHEGVVSNIFHDEGYGFLSTLDGAEVYFHRNAIENEQFLQLDIGNKVKFILAIKNGQKGPQASLVRLR
jgi:cold shock CspA family protein/ribosome-associated translation inhibitor RaiA